LHERTGSWSTATAWYHSATPELGADYQRKVMAVWPEEKARQPDSLHTALAAAWAATRDRPAAGAGQSPPQLPYGRFSGFTAGRPQPSQSLPLARLVRTPTGRTLAEYRAMPIPLATLRARPILTR
jgi:hypothetical protein